MPWCKKCGCEYRSEYDTCAKCNLRLVPQRPVVAPEPERRTPVQTSVPVGLLHATLVGTPLGLVILWAGAYLVDLLFGLVPSLHPDAAWIVVAAMCASVTGFITGTILAATARSTSVIASGFFVYVGVSLFIATDWSFSPVDVLYLLFPALLAALPYGISALWGWRLRRNGKWSELLSLLYVNLAFVAVYAVVARFAR